MRIDWLGEIYCAWSTDAHWIFEGVSQFLSASARNTDVDRVGEVNINIIGGMGFVLRNGVVCARATILMSCLACLSEVAMSASFLRTTTTWTCAGGPPMTSVAITLGRHAAHLWVGLLRVSCRARSASAFRTDFDSEVWFFECQCLEHRQILHLYIKHCSDCKRLCLKHQCSRHAILHQFINCYLCYKEHV